MAGKDGLAWVIDMAEALRLEVERAKKAEAENLDLKARLAELRRVLEGDYGQIKMEADAHVMALYSVACGKLAAILLAPVAEPAKESGDGSGDGDGRG